MPKFIKNTTRSFHPQPIEIKAYKEDESICPVRIVVEYIKATEKLENLKTFLSVTINIIFSLHSLPQGT